MTELTWNVLHLDYQYEAARIAATLREVTSRVLHKRGLVVATSGGIDSSLCAALAVRAVGSERVLALSLPERDSSPEAGERTRALAEHLGIRLETIDIEPTLAAIGCYEARDAAVRRVLPEYGEGWRMKVAIAGGVQGRVSHFHLVARAPGGQLHERRLELPEYLAIVAATSFKQRVRKTLEYVHADRLDYAVVGTLNRLEYDQGVFVKNGDGAADLEPIAHLYKTQVYGMAWHLGLPESVCTALPTTSTYSLPQAPDELDFPLPYRAMDLALWAFEHGVPATALARVLETDGTHARAVYEDILTKRRTTRYLHEPPVLMAEAASDDDDEETLLEELTELDAVS